MPDIYRCPYADCAKGLTTLAGWKGHMSRKHGSFSEAQLLAASQGDVVDDVKSRMEQFAGNLDGVPVTINEDGSVTEKPQPAKVADALPLPSPTRKVRATPKNLTRVLSGIPEKILEALGITPDNEDKKAIEESADFLQDIFGFDFEVDEKKTTIRSRWWAFLWVGGVIGLVWIKHKGSAMFKMPNPTDETAFPAEEKKE